MIGEPNLQCCSKRLILNWFQGSYCLTSEVHPTELAAINSACSHIKPSQPLPSYVVSHLAAHGCEVYLAAPALVTTKTFDHKWAIHITTLTLPNMTQDGYQTPLIYPSSISMATKRVFISTINSGFSSWKVIKSMVANIRNTTVVITSQTKNLKTSIEICSNGLKKPKKVEVLQIQIFFVNKFKEFQLIKFYYNYYNY